MFSRNKNVVYRGKGMLPDTMWVWSRGKIPGRIFVQYDESDTRLEVRSVLRMVMIIIRC